ncbi:hypothetical protein M1B72_03200 [Geomonas paludis]|uniref:Fibronectin type-III domain-containing protein n=1 Tax=Geomonas paludis TaxID=2740185 RepID=A0ABY4LIF2_9BACT|nr:hypothetical protein [Geomonas paludis]UPU36730.1 hypothetical protein M1B72_03200 [Geomonas paludis]
MEVVLTTTVASSRIYCGVTGALTSSNITVTETPAVVNPTVTAASPALQQGTSGTVTITGTGFNAVQSVAFSGTGVTAGSPTTVNATTVTVPVTVTAAATAGTRNVTVTNTDGGVGTGTGVFTVSAAPAPTVTSTSPASMKQGTGPTTVTITGTNFLSGATVAFSDATIQLGTVTYVSPTTLTVPVTVPAGTPVGSKNVTVTLPGGQTGTGTGVFIVESPCVAGQPTALTHGAETATSVPLTWTAGASTDYFTVYRDGAQIATNVLPPSYTDTTASSNTSYSYTVAGNNTAAGCQSAQSAATTAVTLAKTPVAPAVTNVGSGTQLTVAVNTDGNPATTEYAIRINGGQYVQAGGTIGASAAWLTKAAWGVTTVSGLTSGTTYTFDVKARNSALVETGFGPTSAVLAKIALSSSITSCSGCHGYPPLDGTGRNTPAGQFKGSHAKHTSILTCANCHKDNGVSPAGNKHSDGNIDIASPLRQVAGESYGQATHAVSESPTFSSCTTYCHSQGVSKTSNTGETRTTLSAPVTTLVWGTGTSTCSSCHGAPPSYARDATTWGAAKANAHQGTTHSQQTCDVCHSSVTYSGGVYTTNAQHADGYYSIKPSLGYTYASTGGTCSTAGCHGSVAWNGTLGCIDCHKITYTRTKGRPGATLSAVTTEFGLAWGHKKSGRGAVTDADCIVCHLEGNFSTQKTSSFHQNGNIDLRDPDGVGEVAITNVSGLNSGTFTFQRFTTSYVAGSRFTDGHTRDTIDNVITQKFCLKCHDSNGATNTTARSGVSPTQYLPFGTGALNNTTYYTLGLSAGVAGGVVDVDTQFLVTNSSRHPVKGPFSAGYPGTGRLAAPYNNFTRTPGTLANSVVLNCFDCHNEPSPQPLLTTRTVTAHGNADTIRGTSTIAPATTPSTTNRVSLCVICHTGYDTNANPDHGTSGTGTTATAIPATALDRTEKVTFMRYGCNMCHSSGMNPARQRPIRGEDAHGFNALRAQSGSANLAVSGRWSTGTDKRPYAFIRNATFFTTHSPKTIGGTAYTAECNMAGANGDGSSICKNQGLKSYVSGGGVY